MDGQLNCLIVFCSTFICIYGGNQDLPASCEVALLVRRGTTLRAVPQQNLEVSCPIKNCGESLSVTWCKVRIKTACEQISETENIEITQVQERGDLVSYLRFKKVSAHEEGLYRCRVIGHTPEVFSHVINISVSAGSQIVEPSGDKDGGKDSSKNTGDKYVWLPYFCICVGLIFLIAAVILVTLLRYHSQNGKWTWNSINREETSSHMMIPGLPQRNSPSAPLQDTHVSAVNDIYSTLVRKNTKSPVSYISSDSQPVVANPADKNQVELSSAYAVIDHNQIGRLARKQHATSTENDSTDYAAVKVR
ncbi:B- and T-lymphocyte attenuator-like [Menidia menidia]